MKKFTENQVFTNFLKSHPRQKFDLFSGSSYINDRVSQGSQVQAGNLSLYEVNVNRQAGTSSIYPFITKDGAKDSFTVTTKAAFSALLYGDIISGTYPMTSSLSRSYISQAAQTSSHMRALRNTLNFYKGYSKLFDYETYYAAPTTVNLVSIPSIFFDAGIEKGSVRVKFYFTGSLIAEAADTRYNGLLIETTGSNAGSVIGTVLYNEGFLAITASYNLSSVHQDTYENGANAYPQWLNWGSYNGDGCPSSSSYSLEFRGTNTIPVLTMFAEAGKNELNFSFNPTFLSQSGKTSPTINRSSFMEPTGNVIHSINKSSFSTYKAPFESVTYISQIGIFDKNKKLIAIAKLANPVKKTEDVGYTFRLTMDI